MSVIRLGMWGSKMPHFWTDFTKVSFLTFKKLELQSGNMAVLRFVFLQKKFEKRAFVGLLIISVKFKRISKPNSSNFFRFEQP